MREEEHWVTSFTPTKYRLVSDFPQHPIIYIEEIPYIAVYEEKRNRYYIKRLAFKGEY